MSIFATGQNYPTNCAPNRPAFTLIELLVVISIIALLMAILIPAMNKARIQAKELLELSNLRQWGLIFLTYAQNNDGKFMKGFTWDIATAEMWMNELRPFYSDRKEKLVCCPLVTEPGTQRHGGTFKTWNLNPPQHSWERGGDYGSYGENHWISYAPPDRQFAEPVSWNRPTKNYWGTPYVEGAINIPLFLDCGFYDTCPDNDPRPPAEDGKNPPPYGMSEFCMDRHRGHIFGVFMDSHARRIGLKELWTLKWHRAFNTANDYTIAGWGGNRAACAAFWDSPPPIGAPWMKDMPEY